MSRLSDKLLDIFIPDRICGSGYINFKMKCEHKNELLENSPLGGYRCSDCKMQIAGSENWSADLYSKARIQR